MKKKLVIVILKHLLVFCALGVRVTKCPEVHKTVPNNELLYQLPTAPLLKNAE